jgi:hypothetical protein
VPSIPMANDEWQDGHRRDNTDHMKGESVQSSYSDSYSHSDPDSEGKENEQTAVPTRTTWEEIRANYRARNGPRLQ